MLPAQAGSQVIPDAGLGVAIRGLLVAQAIGLPNETNVSTDCPTMVSVRCRPLGGKRVPSRERRIPEGLERRLARECQQPARCRYCPCRTIQGDLSALKRGG